VCCGACVLLQEVPPLVGWSGGEGGGVISFMHCCVALWSWQFNGTLLVWMGQVCVFLAGGGGQMGGVFVAQEKKEGQHACRCAVWA
jgi:hypothetical protein